MVDVHIDMGKPWTEMTRDEKLTAYDQISAAFKECAEAMRLEFDEILVRGQCTMRSTVKILLDVDPNDDPRLPG